MKRISLILLLFAVFACACKKSKKCTGNCGGEEIVPDPGFTVKGDGYVVLFLTNTSVDQADAINTGLDANSAYTFVGELPKIFGNIEANDPIKYAYGLSGPMLLTQSVQQMQNQVNKAFDIAEKYNVPVYFQLDDINNWTTSFGSGATPKFYENPSWCEWIAFPQTNESWGGQSNGRLPYYWFNWGSWLRSEAFPNMESPGLRNFLKSQLQDGVLSALVPRYNALKAAGKGYLFAGMAIGWETHIPDYTADNSVYNVKVSNLPSSTSQGVQMQTWEAAKYGYAALHTLGYTNYDKERLYKVIHDYSEFLSKTVFDSGIPKEKIFTHIVGLKSKNPGLSTTFAPPIWTAVNNYSTPGFTMSPVTCPYNVDVLKSEITKAEPGQKRFANVEGYARGVNETFKQADTYFDDMFGNGASMVAVYGWGRNVAGSPFAVSHSPTSPFVKVAKKWIDGP